MNGSRKRMLLVVSVAALTALATGLLIGLSDDRPEPRFEVEATDRPIQGTGGMTEAPRAVAGDATVAEPLQGGPTAAEEQAEQGLAEGPSGPAPASSDELSSAAVVKRYLAAIDARDGGVVCASFMRGALAPIEFPSPQAACPETVEASLGFRHPGGLPVWRSSKAAGPISSKVDGDTATVTVTVTTDYAGDREPSIEDDVVYLERNGKVWRIVKPSATLYRAIGIADVPIEAIAPPE